MHEAKLIVYSAALCSAFAVLACILIIPSLYSTINEIHAEVIDGVQLFRVDTDAAWTEVMNIQMSMTPPSRARENPFNSLFRRKRQDFSGLPSYCVCEPPKIVCPPGPPGPAGDPGPDGRKLALQFMIITIHYVRCKPLIFDFICTITTKTDSGHGKESVFLGRSVSSAESVQARMHFCAHFISW